MTRTESLAETIREAIAERGMSHRELAVAANLSESSLSHRLTGRTPWDLGDLDHVAAALGTTASALLDRAEALATATPLGASA